MPRIRTKPQEPSLRDSDIIFIAVKRLERAAEMMQKFQYDIELEEHLEKAGELLAWVGWSMSQRGEKNE
jgi:hypothetical protein